MLATGSEMMDGASAVEPRLWTTGDLCQSWSGVSVEWRTGQKVLSPWHGSSAQDSSWRGRPPEMKSSARRRMPPSALCEQQVLG